MRDNLMLALLAFLAWGTPAPAMERPIAATLDDGSAVLGSRPDVAANPAKAARAPVGSRRNEVGRAEATTHPRGRAGTLAEGVAFMVIGMTVTFLFLFVMVVCMHGMHRFLVFFDRFFPVTTTSPAPPARSESAEDQIALAIAVAHARNKE